MAGIYGHYRREPYFITRGSWEPSYTEMMNADMSDNDAVVEVRQQVVRDAISRHEGSLGRSVITVVDIGGDKGQFIPHEVPNRVLVDVSDSEVVSGVVRLRRLEDLSGIPDFVMLCGILEHLSSPDLFLREVVQTAGTSGAVLIYVEVPAGVPERRSGLRDFLEWSLAQMAVRSRASWRLLDRYQTRGRDKSRGVRWRFLRQSEHINFFSEGGLRQLADRVGLRSLDITTYRTPEQLDRHGRLQFNTVISATFALGID